ncbi:MAG: hypothetical protein Q7S22_01405 [Candidatus Micrarchaeota archaeon]|nr:hypothetical protein [Candidatus Micrarchaeota archaeon]
MRKKFGRYSETEASNRIAELLQRIRESIVFVEGKRDKEALIALGCNAENIYTISGNLKQSCEQVMERNVKIVMILTDLDRRGNELAKRAGEELERYSITIDGTTRIEIARTLNLRFFEDLERKYLKFLEEIKQSGKI